MGRSVDECNEEQDITRSKFHSAGQLATISKDSSVARQFNKKLRFQVQVVCLANFNKALLTPKNWYEPPISLASKRIFWTSTIFWVKFSSTFKTACRGWNKPVHTVSPFPKKKSFPKAIWWKSKLRTPSSGLLQASIFTSKKHAWKSWGREMLRKRTNGLSTKEKTLETNGKLSKTYEIRCGA